MPTLLPALKMDGERSADPKQLPQAGMDKVSTPSASSSAGFVLEYYDDPSAVSGDWKAFEKHAVCTLYQSYGWSLRWVRHAAPSFGETPLIVLARDAHGEIAFIWPMAIVRKMGIRVLTWLGQDYAGYNMGIYRRDVFARLARNDLKLLLQKIARDHSEIAAVNFYQQPETWDGMTNPFKHLQSIGGYEPAFVIRAEGDFDSYCGKVQSSKTRYKLRRSENKLDEAGEFLTAAAKDTAEKREVVKLFLEHKAFDLAELGVPNPYANPGLVDFMFALAEKTDDGLDFELDYVSLDGEVLATAGGAAFQDRVYCLTISMNSKSPLSKWSPGLVLVKEFVKHAFEKKAAYVDFGIGPGQHKATWRPEEKTLFNSYFALRLRGLLQPNLRLLGLWSKRQMKYNPYLRGPAIWVRDKLRMTRRFVFSRSSSEP